MLIIIGGELNGSSTAPFNRIHSAGCYLMTIKLSKLKNYTPGIFAILVLILLGLFSVPLQTTAHAGDNIPAEWQEISKSLAENQTQYRFTEALISGLDDLMKREEQGEIMLYLSLLEEFQIITKNEPEKFEPKNDLSETLSLLENFSRNYRTDKDFEPEDKVEIEGLREISSSQENIYSQLEKLSKGNISDNLNLAEMYLILQEQKYRENIENIKKLNSPEKEKTARVFYELGESLTLFLNDEMNDREIQDEETAELFHSIMKEEIKSDVSSEKIKNTIDILLSTSIKYTEPESEILDEIKDLRMKLQ